MDFEEKLRGFRLLLTLDTIDRLEREDLACKANVTLAVAESPPGGKKYRKVDQGHSGRFLVEIETGIIYGIKAYGKVHKGRVYGTLDTIEEWDWGGYHPIRKEDR